MTLSLGRANHVFVWGTVFSLGCGDKPLPERPMDGPVSATTTTTELEADPFLPLPFVSVGEAPSGVLVVSGSAPDGLKVEASEPFVVKGDLGPLWRSQSRDLVVEWAGPVDEPVNAVGTVTISSGDVAVTVLLAAVIGDSELGVAEWVTDDWGQHTTVTLPSAPNAHGATIWTDESVYLAVPLGLTMEQPLGSVTWFHGWYADLSRVVSEQYLREQLSLSGRHAVLIAPQGPEINPSGDFGQLMEAGGHERLVRDARAVLYRDRMFLWPDVGPASLAAHSGGYLPVYQALDIGGLPIDSIHLFDAMYEYADEFAEFALDGGILRSAYSTTGGTTEVNSLAAAFLLAEGVTPGATFGDDALAGTDVSIGAVRSEHEDVMVDDRSVARWLAASGLPRTDTAPPELRSVVADGVNSAVSWFSDAGDSQAEVVVEGSENGLDWTELGRSSSSPMTVPVSPRVRAAYERSGVRSSNSDVYGGTGMDWLVVDGFDRVLEGSWRLPTHDFAASVGVGLGVPFSTASNEAVAAGQVLLSDFPYVLWLLGDDSVADETFDANERLVIESFVDAGGRLCVSGGEVGYATDAAWLASVLHVDFVSDSADTDKTDLYTFGVAYPEDYPDVLAATDGGEIAWFYDSGDVAAVVWEDQIAVIGFPVETLAEADLPLALAEVQGWIAGP